MRLIERLRDGEWRGLKLEDLQEAEVGVVTADEVREYGGEVEGTVMIFPFNDHHFFYEECGRQDKERKQRR